MKKIIGVVNPIAVEFEEKSLEKGCGGSETWAIKLCDAFAAHEDIHVVCFCYCDGWHFSESGVEYIPYHFFKSVCDTRYFDHMIISRTINESLDIIKETGCCHSIYIMLHDIYLWETSGREVTHWLGRWRDNQWRRDNVKKILLLSDWHKEFAKQKMGFPDDMYYITANGVDTDMIEECVKSVKKRDNSMLWSSRFERHFDVLVEKIAPLVRKKIPDFKVYACSYTDDLEEKYKHLCSKDYVVNLGSLNKEDLYKEMAKHKCWFYPSIFTETFCITVLEQVLCGNIPVVVDRYGPSTILKPYKHFLIDKDVDFYKDDKVCQEAADLIVDYIKNYNKPHNQSLLKSMQYYIKTQYNWDKIASDLLELFD